MRLRHLGLASVTTLLLAAGLAAVPAIGLDATIVPLGLRPDGSMETPRHLGEVGWYRFAASPGAKGATVLAGHVDGRRGPAVFFRLRALRPGDRVHVVTADGREYTYAVRSRHEYSKSAFPTDDVFGTQVTPTLRLITCAGDFDRRTGHYRSNLVVTAQPLPR